MNIGFRSCEENGLGKGGDQRRSAEQRELRQRKGERAFLFDKDLSRCLVEVDRDEWEWALSSCGGDVVRAARECGLDGVPPGAKALRAVPFPRKGTRAFRPVSLAL